MSRPGEVRTQNDIDVIHEVEFELKQGPAESLIHFAQGWIKKYQLWLDVRSKAERGTLLALGQKPPKQYMPSLLNYRKKTVLILF